MGRKVLDLGQVGAARLAKAVRSVIEGRRGGAAQKRWLPSQAQLRAGADATHASSDDLPARYFQSILELGYLVASADGFADEEGRALAALLEQATGAAVKKDELELHFKDLEDGCVALGRRERLRRAAADFEGTIDRTEAVGFATLVAAADGVLADAEVESLQQLGGYLELSRADVDKIVDGVTQDIQQALES